MKLKILFLKRIHEKGLIMLVVALFKNKTMKLVWKFK